MSPADCYLTIIIAKFALRSGPRKVSPKKEMKLLEDRILSEGKCLEGGILKVDGFINHQIDPQLMQEIAREFARLFAGCGATKVLTVEASGIAPALLTGIEMGLPVVFAKKQKPSTMDNMLTADVHSFTKWQPYTLCVSRDYISPNDQILFIDDFMAYGNAAMGALSIVEEVGANIVGMGFLVEKEFQHGAEELRKRGIHVESLAVIESLDNNEIKIKGR